MFDINQLPENIFRKVRGLTYNKDSIGESGSDVLLFDEMALKIENTCESANNEKIMLEWLDGKLPVPRIVEFEQADAKNYLLMTRLRGEMACSDLNMASPEHMVKALADGLKMLWKVDVSSCPVKNGLDEKLKAAKYNIENDLVDLDDLNDDTLSEDGFSDIQALYDFLCAKRPKQDFALSLSHGDYCLPNVFVSGDKAVGFLDLGNAGVADIWQDIALCVRSFEHNLCLYGYNNNDFIKYKELLFNELGIKPDEEKIKYYILLDELF